MPRNAKNLFLNSRLQGQQVAISVLSYFLGCASMSAAMFCAYVLFTHEMTAKQDTVLQLNVIGHFLTAGFPVAIAVCVGFGVLIVVPIAVVLSHRVAGPIVAIRRYINGLREGNYSAELKLRDNDELSEVAADLHVLAQQLSSKRS